MKWLLLAALTVLVLYFPAAVAALIGALGTLAVTAAAQPAVWAFLAGMFAAPRIREWAR